MAAAELILDFVAAAIFVLNDGVAAARAAGLLDGVSSPFSTGFRHVLAVRHEATHAVPVCVPCVNWLVSVVCSLFGWHVCVPGWSASVLSCPVTTPSL